MSIKMHSKIMGSARKGEMVPENPRVLIEGEDTSVIYERKKILGSRPVILNVQNIPSTLCQALFTSLLRKVYIIGFSNGVRMLYMSGMSLAFTDDPVGMGLK